VRRGICPGGGRCTLPPGRAATLSDKGANAFMAARFIVLQEPDCYRLNPIAHGSKLYHGR
jgi:hypothetical protein